MSYEVCSARSNRRTHFDSTTQVFYEPDQARDDPDIPARWTQSAMTAHTLIVKRLKERDIVI